MGVSDAVTVVTPLLGLPASVGAVAGWVFVYPVHARRAREKERRHEAACPVHANVNTNEADSILTLYGHALGSHRGTDHDLDDIREVAIPGGDAGHRSEQSSPAEQSVNSRPPLGRVSLDVGCGQGEQPGIHFPAEARCLHVPGRHDAGGTISGDPQTSHMAEYQSALRSDKRPCWRAFCLPFHLPTAVSMYKSEYQP